MTENVISPFIFKNIRKQSSLTGYVVGGWMGSRNKSTIDKLSYSNETVSVNSSTFGINVASGAGFSSSTFGYHCGGVTSVKINTIKKINFSNETTETSASTLSGQTSDPNGINSTSNGYAVGGIRGTSRISVVDKIQLSNDSRTTLSIGLSESRADIAMLNNSNFFYAIGGWLGSSPSSTIDIFSFSTDTRSIGSTGSSDQIAQGLSSNEYGYTLRYYSSGDEVDRWNLSTLTKSSTGGTLPTAFWGLSSLQGTGSGYWAGGQTTSNTLGNKIYKQVFSNDTASLISSTLTASVRAASPITNGGF